MMCFGRCKMSYSRIPNAGNKRHIHLLYLLDKDEQEDLDDNQRKALRKMVADLKKL